MDEERTITLDLGSSPDPLIDPILSPPMVPPSHIKTRSQASQRLYTLSTSPRKRTFELDVGNKMSPQRLRVTVEADNETTRSTSRRLFQSPSPSRRMSPQKETTITTTVPLRGLTDDEAPSATPRRRGRPRKSGTPITTRRKRQGTPARSRGSGAHAFFSPEKDVLTSDINEDVTPRPSTQPRRVAKRKPTSPAKEDGAPGSQPRKRGRPRKQPTTSDGPAARSDLGTAPSAPVVNAPINTTQVELSGATNQGADEMEDDIWLGTMSDGPTPVASRWQQHREPELPTRKHPSPEQPQPEQPQTEPPQPEPPRAESEYQQQYDWPELGGGMDSQSEAESLPSETAMAGEEFTMIDLASLLSMQQDSSLRAQEPQEIDQDASLIINRTLEELRQSLNKPNEGAVSAEPAAVVTEAEGVTENVAEENTQQPAAQSLPPPPPKSPQAWSQSPRRPKAQPLAKQLALKTLQQGPPTLDGAESQNASAYDDSFSEIPEAVLAAATPRPFRRTEVEVDKTTDEDIQLSIERPSRVNQSNPQSETNRLLTPDETPSPIPSPIPSDTDQREHDSEAKSKSPKPATDFEMHSSPPIGSPVAQQHRNDSLPQHNRANSTETPAEQLASLTLLTAGRDTLPVHLPRPDPQTRPSLSPIIRVSRPLQIVTSDPPSPPARDSFLGSPFRGSMAKSNQSPAPVSGPERATKSPSPPRASNQVEPPPRSWLAPWNHIRDVVARSLSPSRVSVSGTGHMDDPFGPDPAESTGLGSGRQTLFSGPSRRDHDRDATVSVASSVGANSVRDDDEMSWQREGSPAEASQKSASPSSDLFAPHRSASGGQDLMRNREEPFRERESAIGAKVAEPQANTNEPAQGYEEGEEEEDDDDIWLAIGDKRATPYGAKVVPSRREPLPEPPRRAAIPIPWRQNSSRPDYSHGLQRDPDNDTPMSEDEEFSMLAPKQPERTPAVANPPPAKKPDLAGFFSSPAILPNLPGASGFGLSKVLDSRRPEQPNPIASNPRTMPVAPGPEPPRNSLLAHYLQPETQTQLPSVPQKHLEIGRPKSVELFSPVRNTAERSITGKAPTAPAPRSSSSDIPAEEITTARLPQKVNFNSRQRHSGSTIEKAASVASRSASLITREDLEEPETTHIPQKMNFSPRQRNPDESTLFQPTPAASLATSLFGNDQVSKFFRGSRPQPRPPARLREEAPEEDGSSFVSPPPRPLPNRAMSPGKSCMRSPLKPKTPGRVVEFTGSTLSPLAQAQARAERRATMSPEKQADEGGGSKGRSGRASGGGSDSGGGSGSGPAVQQEDKENSEEPPEPEMEPEPEPEVEEEAPRHRTSRPATSSSRPAITAKKSAPTTSISTVTATATATKPTARLSPTHWSRPHWLRLDELLQARKRGSQHFQTYLSRTRPSSSSSSFSTKSTQTSRQSLLGKLVTSQGETMPLEGWHLDVVEAFRDEVGDGDGGVWDEAQIAKRVFALLVGEERRRLGRVPDRSGDGA